MKSGFVLFLYTKMVWPVPEVKLWNWAYTVDKSWKLSSTCVHLCRALLNLLTLLKPGTRVN